MFLSFILELLAIAVLSIFQLTSLPLIASVKPDIVLLAILAMSAYDKHWTRRLSWLIVAVAILKFSPGIDWRLILFTASSLFGMILVDYLPWKRFISFLVALTISGYVANFGFFGFQWGAVFREIIWDLMIGIIVFGLIFVFYAKKEIH